MMQSLKIFHFGMLFMTFWSNYQVRGDFPEHLLPLEPNFCRDKSEGVYVDVTSDCQRYVTCNGQVDEMRLIHFCQEGHRFDQESCDCLHSSKVKCIKDDHKKLKPCVRSIPRINTTPAKLRSDKCSGKSTGLYPDVSSGCQKYYACVDNVPTTYDYNCGPTSMFDVKRCTCLPLGLGTCTSQDESTGCTPKPPPTQAPTSTVAPPPPSDYCIGKGPGYYADISRGCEWFFVCFGGNFETTQFQCPSKLRFNHFTCQCEYPYTVLCTVLDETPCIPTGSFPLLPHIKH